jgi:hypothetical protein
MPTCVKMAFLLLYMTVTLKRMTEQTQAAETGLTLENLKLLHL